MNQQDIFFSEAVTPRHVVKEQKTSRNCWIAGRYMWTVSTTEEILFLITPLLKFGKGYTGISFNDGLGLCMEDIF